MTEIITYRLSATGVWGYEFYRERLMIGSVSAVVSPSAPVQIESANCRWYSRFDMDTTVVPGIGRRIMDNRNGQELFRLVYWNRGLYQAKNQSRQSINIEIRNGSYLFGEEGMPVIAMTERMNSPELWVPRYDVDEEAYFKTVFFEEVSEAFALMVLSFPALRFY